MQKAVSAFNMRNAIAADSVKSRRNIRALEARQSNIQKRKFLTLVGKPNHFKNVTMPFDNDRFLVDLIGFWTDHSSLSVFAEGRCRINSISGTTEATLPKLSGWAIEAMRR